MWDVHSVQGVQYVHYVKYVQCVQGVQVVQCVHYVQYDPALCAARWAKTSGGLFRAGRSLIDSNRLLSYS